MNAFEFIFGIILISIILAVVLFSLSAFNSSSAGNKFTSVFYNKISNFIGYGLVFLTLIGFFFSLIYSYHNPSIVMGLFDIILILFFGYFTLNFNFILNQIPFLNQLGIFYTFLTNAGFWLFAFVILILETIINFR